MMEIRSGSSRQGLTAPTTALAYTHIPSHLCFFYFIAFLLHLAAWIGTVFFALFRFHQFCVYRYVPVFGILAAVFPLVWSRYLKKSKVID